MGCCVYDFINTFDKFPKPDSKVRSLSNLSKIGGNASNVAISLSRLNVNCKIITKLGDD